MTPIHAGDKKDTTEPLPSKCVSRAYFNRLKISDFCLNCAAQSLADVDFV